MPHVKPEPREGSACSSGLAKPSSPTPQKAASPVGPSRAGTVSPPDPNQPGRTAHSPGAAVQEPCSHRAVRGTRARSPGNEGLSGATAPCHSCVTPQQNKGCTRSRAGSSRTRRHCSHQQRAALPSLPGAASALTQKKVWQVWHRPAAGLGTARPPPWLLPRRDQGDGGGGEHHKKKHSSSRSLSSVPSRQDTATPERSIMQPTVILLARFSASTQSCRSF